MTHVSDSKEGRRHDWIHYVNNGCKESLLEVLVYANMQNNIYRYSSCNRRWNMNVSFPSVNLNTSQTAFGKAMSLAKSTGESVFKKARMYLAAVVYKRKLKVNESPVGLLPLLAVHLCNFCKCIFPNRVVQYTDWFLQAREQYVNHK